MESYIEVSMLDDMINPSNAGRVYIQDPNLVITVPAAVPALKVQSHLQIQYWLQR